MPERSGFVVWGNPGAMTETASVSELLNLVAGAWEPGEGAGIVDTNPARPAEVVARGAAASRAQALRAIEAAGAAAPGWARTPPRERAGVLSRAGALLADRAEELGRELAREEGKALLDAVGEVRRAADILGYYAAEADRDIGEIFASPRAGERILVVRKPVGVVGMITPFNFPIAIPAWKIAPALVYGNAVVWKPAGPVPLLAVRFAEALAEAGLPAKVLSLLLGESEVGAAIVEHPAISAVSFTGSTAVGRALMRTCGELGKPIQTEMGGKNAAVVLADADLDLAAGQIIRGFTGLTGQMCTATSRLVVEASAAEELLAAIVHRADKVAVGDPLDPEVQMGPLVSAAARDTVTAAVDAAVTRGAVARTGDPRYREGALAEGWFAAPTILDVPSPDIPVWSTEVFGPVLSWLAADSAQEALRLANDSRYGLSGAVFTRDLGRALAAIDEFDVGVLHVNSGTAGADIHVPFGGAKDSGFGAKEQGRALREFLTRTTTVYLAG